MLKIIKTINIIIFLTIILPGIQCMNDTSDFRPNPIFIEFLIS